MQFLLPIGLIFLGIATGLAVNYLADVLPYALSLRDQTALEQKPKSPEMNFWNWLRTTRKKKGVQNLRFWLVELVSICCALWVWYSPPEQLRFLWGYILLVYFGLVVVIDIEHRVILNPVSLVGGAFAFGIGAWLHGFRETMIGGAAGFVIMLLLFYFGEFIIKRIGRWRGDDQEEVALGFGDVKLAGVIGLLLGWPGIGAGIVLAILAGGAASMLYIIMMLATRRYKSYAAIPYGPFLIFGAVALIYFGDSLSKWIF